MSSSRASGLLLWTRAGTLGSVVMLLGSVSHVSAGGLLPDLAWLAVMLAVGTLLGARFLLQAATPRRLVTLVVAGQALVHLGLTVSAGHRTSASVGGRLPSLGSATIGHLVEHTADTGSAMLLAHLTAAVAVGLWLAVGESALWALLALTSTHVRALVAAARRALGRRNLPQAAPDQGLALAGNFPAGIGPRRRLDRRVASPRGPPQQPDV